jgi:hypothetical protein
MTKRNMYIGIGLSVVLATAVFFWEYLLSLLNMKPDSDELVLGLFHVGNSWPWNATIGLFGVAFIYVATTDRWYMFDSRALGETFAAFGALCGFVAAFLVRDHPTNGLLGWKGMAAVFSVAATLSCLAFAKDHGRSVAMGLLGAALGVSMYVGAAAGAFVTIIIAAAFFVGFAVDTLRLVRNMRHRM